MGEAYDHAGNLLGSATGQTKQEVLDKLAKEFGEKAKEIRIRNLATTSPGLVDKPTIQDMTRYVDQCETSGPEDMTQPMRETARSKLDRRIVGLERELMGLKQLASILAKVEDGSPLEELLWSLTKRW